MVREVLMILILLVFKFSIAQDYKRAPNSYIYDINYAEGISVRRFTNTCN